MKTFQNKPRGQFTNSEGKIRQFIHQPLTLDHFGTHIKILENGKVIISRIAEGQDPKSEEIEYDEITVPASVIFKIHDALEMTRTIKWITPEEAAKIGSVESEENSTKV